MKALLERYPDEVQAILARYPEGQKRSAVMPLLYLAQREQGVITLKDMAEIGELTGIEITEVGSIVGFYTLYHDSGPRFRVQVCTDLPCALRGADEFLKHLCENVGVRVGDPTPDGALVIEEVTCLAGCHHAPMFQLQGDGEITYHEDQTVESAAEMIAELRRRAAGGAHD